MSFVGNGYTNSILAFNEAMGDRNNTMNCEELCVPNCDETTYEYTIDTTELSTEELCNNNETKQVHPKLILITIYVNL
jgi:hypothetical protein